MTLAIMKSWNYSFNGDRMKYIFLRQSTGAFLASMSNNNLKWATVAAAAA